MYLTRWANTKDIGSLTSIFVPDRVEVVSIETIPNALGSGPPPPLPPPQNIDGVSSPAIDVAWQWENQRDHSRDSEWGFCIQVIDATVLRHEGHEIDPILQHLIKKTNLATELESTMNSDISHRALQSMCIAGTGQSFLETPAFDNWKKTPSVLWTTGIGEYFLCYLC